MDLSIFKNDCISINPDLVVQKYLLDGSSYFFNNYDIVDEFSFKKAIALSLNVHIREIAIVGSGKLGFSIKPDIDEPSFFPFHKFDSRKKSDLDIAIVSNSLFDSQLMRLFEHTSHYSNNEIWKKNTHRKSLAYYILKGWMKPEYIPSQYKISEKIQDTQSLYKMKFGRDINIGIYKSWYYFENYHINNIRNIYLNLVANG